MTRRLTLALPALLAVGALLAACSGGTGDEPAPDESESVPAPDESESVPAPDEGEQMTDEANGTVTIYAAASLEAAFTDIITGFEEANPGVSVEAPVYDGSSTLVTQLTEGAQADVFASADEPNMQDLVAEGLTDGEPQLFATNTLVIAVADGNPQGIEGLADLEGLAYAICAPEVPCGNATDRLLAAEGITADAVSQEQNVTAVAERVISGEVDAGLVYATDVATREDDLDAVVPEGAADVVNRYPIAALTGSDPTGALFVAYVLSADGQAVLAGYGFGAP